MTIDHYASLREGLVGAWCPSIAGSGFMLPDLSGRGNHGTLTNMEADDWVSGQYGRMLDLDGTFDYVNLGANHNFTGAFSLSIWANLRSASGFKVIISKSDFGLNRREFIFYISSTELVTTDPLAFLITNPNSFGNRIGRSVPNASIPLNQLASFICIYTGNGTSSGISIHVNGIKSDTTDQSSGTFTGVATQTTPLAIGTDFNSFPNLGSQSNMTFDDCRVYNRALTPSEVAILASRPGIGLSPSVDVPVMPPIATSARRRRILTGAH